MGSVNVNRSVSDAFYRYKMPKILAKVEGKGNGIKTVIVNMIEVAKSIGRPPTYPTKFFGCELGAQTQFDYKNDRYIVNGSHDAAKLQDLLDGFIRKFVLCPDCDNPETDLLVSAKKGTISLGCKACGYHDILQFVHKLNTFILKNPPNLNPAVQGSSLTEGKRAKRSKKANGEYAGPELELDQSCGSGTSGASGGNPTGGDADIEVPDEIDDELSVSAKELEWSADVSEEAVRARMQDLTDGVKHMTFTEDLEKTEKERLDMFYMMVKTKKDVGMLDDTVAHQKELVLEAERLDIKQKAPLILAELLFDQNICVQAKKHRLLLLRFTIDDKRAQRYLMGGIEQVLALHRDVLMCRVPGILKLFYDLDILTEPVIVDWADKVSKKYVPRETSAEIHRMAEPFIKWLQEADTEESEGDTDDSEGVEIEYDDRAKPDSLRREIVKVPVISADGGLRTTNNKNAAGEDDAGPDIDIDDI